jgi:HK97 family phage portal protein
MNFVTKTFSFLKKSFAISDSSGYQRQLHSSGIAGTSSGQVVSVDTAMQLSVVWACVRLIAETISTLPLLMYENKNGVRQVATNHPLYSLIHDAPNADMTAVEFWEAVISQLCLWGNSYVLKSFNSLGTIIAITPLNPALMTVRRTTSGAITYIYADPRGQKTYTEREIWHVKGFGTDGLVGRSPIRNGLLSVGSAIATEKASASTFTDGMKPSGVVAVKEYLKPDQRAQYKTKLGESTIGTPATGQILLLENGAEYKQVTMNPDDAQMLETRSFNVEDLCRWFNVPPSMIGHGTAVSNWGTGREQIMLGFLAFVLRPYLVRIEQGIKKSLLAPAERLRYYPEYSVEGLLRADSAARSTFYATMVQNGLKTRNEIRALENDPPVDGGDELTVQSNLIPITLLGKITSTAQSAKSTVLEWLGIKEKDDET